MPEKLLTIEEAASMLGIQIADLEKMVAKGELPAYRVGGQFLRFRREQIEAMRSEVLKNTGVRSTPEKTTKAGPRKTHSVSYAQSTSDRFLDFIYFKDFYIISLIIIVAILWFIFN